MKLSWTPYDLQLRHTFTISGYSRKTTPVVLTRLEQDGLVGYGEASLPPYLGETQESVIEFLKGGPHWVRRSYSGGGDIDVCRYHCSS